MMLFGEPWDAPVCEGATFLPEAPDYARCTYCRDYFREGDQGVVMPFLGETDPDYLIGLSGPDREGQAGNLVGVHRECLLAQTVGHVYGVCECTGFPGTVRERAQEVMRRVQAEPLPTFRETVEEAEAAVIDDAARAYREKRGGRQQ